MLRLRALSPPVAAAADTGGAGDSLPHWLLFICGVCTFIATGVSIMSIALQLKNYRMPQLQRNVVRIMVMVPLYAISSLIALYSLNAAFFIDAVRDLYEAFVIYAFLQLLITYLGGERDLLLRLRGRPPIPHPFPVSIFLRPMDPSDPWTLLNLKRGVLQYVQIKPLLVLTTAIMKATNTYHEGDFKLSSGYTWVTVVYNISISLSLYCLAMFWVAVNKDLKPFRPVPKFLCIKGILFFSFWQGVLISFLVSVGAITKVGPYTDPEHMSLAIVDSLICLEMPGFAIAHQYAFQASDYIDPTLKHAARLPFWYAFRDAFGVKDVWEDIKYTFRARGVSYKAYEAADGGIHHDDGRMKRIRAGLRYSKGGKTKYWINAPGVVNAPAQTYGAVEQGRTSPYDSQSDSDLSDAASLDFDSVSEGEDALYERARRIGYAGFPNVDVSKEQERRRRWAEDDGFLSGRVARRSSDALTPQQGPSQPVRRSAKNKGRGKATSRNGVYGAWADTPTGAPGPAPAEVDSAAFDGENENPNAWHSGGAEDTSLRWTKRRLAQPSAAPRAPPPSSVVPTRFVLEDTPEPDAEPERVDAVDLITEDIIEEENLGERERRRSQRAKALAADGFTPSRSRGDSNTTSASRSRQGSNARLVEAAKSRQSGSNPSSRSSVEQIREQPREPARVLEPASVPPAPPVPEPKPLPKASASKASASKPISQPSAPSRRQQNISGTLTASNKSASNSAANWGSQFPKSDDDDNDTPTFNASSFRVPSYAKWSNPDDNPWA
ncbi:hypothetical protein VHUM_01696 [Vanrija humicola]|uniref:DUF300-domain-containing protein n=1 Tax=Vanrija humicola TaxID=5417 RepID=A0A7D8V2M5_VANHU|nr:hypothetical protein VHUM_01696 [Vanrija humicola]